ncbi:MAG: DUF1565 domain-containing protein [Oligosphaeraceae bacterium]|nr:DUF1565 domain-containing protein [Oligosphaeraceae bacterium]
MVKEMITALSLAAGSIQAAEYFVSPGGKDSNTGLSQEQPFQTLQKAQSVFQAGDTLSILPGVYHEGLEFRDFSGGDQPSTIRAVVPGTVVLRGDVDAPAFEPLATSARVWSCSLPVIPEAVNERDTLSIYFRQPSLAELEFNPGSWYYSADEQRLYVNTTDSAAPAQHYLSISDLRQFGVLFSGSGVRNIVVEGLIVTGFNANSPSGSPGSQTKWGVYISYSPKNCRISNVTTYLNGGGICYTGNGEGNIVENCRSYGNHSPNYASGGNIIVLTPNSHGAIRNCVSFDSVKMGIRYYGGLPAEHCQYEGNISFDNQSGDLWMKYPSDTTVARNCIAGHALYARRIENCLFDYGDTGYFGAAQNSIVRPREKNFSEDREFADPLNFDYRPQGDSPYKERAPMAYSAQVYFVSNAGDDANDGNSVRSAWKSLAQAVSRLSSGATLYILPGEWSENIALRDLSGVSIRGRGAYPVTLGGAISLENCSEISLQRLAPTSLSVRGGQSVSLEQCGFAAAPRLQDVQGLRLTHNAVQNGALELERCTDIFVSGNIFAGGFARGGASGWSNGNAYAGAAPGDEPQSFVQVPEFGQSFALRNGHLFAGRSLAGMPVGPYRRQSRPAELQLSDFRLLSRTATTANIEFFASLPVTGTLHYGDTPACEQKIPLRNSSYFQTASLTGLLAGQQYYYKVTLESGVSRCYSNQELSPALQSGRRTLAGEVQEFSTLASDAQPRTYFVATTGDDDADGSQEKPWRTISHAAKVALAGDTVLVQEGRYFENVRVRATGDAGRVLTIRSAPGAKVWLDGCERQLFNGFRLVNKHYVKLDYFYFKFQYDDGEGAGVRALDSDFITLSRCFYDGRGMGYSPSFIKAVRCRNLSLDNCFLTRAFYGSGFSSCPDLLVRNSVFYINQLDSVNLRNSAREKAVFRNNIFVDNTLQKVPNPILVLQDGMSLQEADNCYYLRVSPEIKTVIGYSRLDDKELEMYPPADAEDILSQQWRRQGRFCREMATYQHFLNRTGSTGTAIFADPQLPALPHFVTFTDMADWVNYSRYSKEHQAELHGDEALDFPDFFAQNPELIKRDIGLQRELFRQ